MSFFISQEPYEKEIEAPNGDKGTVTLRRLNAGDQAAIQDTLRMSLAENSDASLALGTMRMLTVRRAIVSWSWRPGPTPETISQLDPDVFEQIYAHVEIGSPPTPAISDGTSPQDGQAAEATAEEPKEVIRRTKKTAAAS